jgi:cytochrome c
MNKKYFYVAALFILVACNSNENAAPTPPIADEKKEIEYDMTESPYFKKGFDLVKQSDCLTCHKEVGRIQGPSYTEVADKYTNDEKNIAMLAQKIIKGGSGNWDKIPMTAHPNISKEDAEVMVKYIFLFKTK